MENAKDYLLPKEVAEIMGIGIGGVYNLMRSKGFPAIPIGKRRYIIPRAAFMAWFTDPNKLLAYKSVQEQAYE